MDSVCLQERSADLRRDICGIHAAAQGIARLVAVGAVLLAGVAAPVHAQNFKVGSFIKPASTAVVFVTSQTANTNNAATLSTPAITPGAGLNRLLVVGLSSNGNLGAMTVTFGGTPLTLVAGTSASNTTRTQFWSLPNPSSAAATVVATWTGNFAVVMGAAVFSNVDQTLPIQNATIATGTSVSPSVTVTSTAGDMTLAIAAKITNMGAATQTARWSVSPANIKGGGSTAAGATSVTHAWAASATSTVWAASGITIKTLGGQTSVVPHGLGMVPSALMMWTGGSTTGTGFAASDWTAFGMSDGTTSYSTSRSSQSGVTTPNASRRAAANALTIVQYGQAVLAEATLTSWTTTNINFTWSTNNSAAYVIHYLAISGVSAKVVNWKPSAGAGAKAVATVGFQPNVVFHMGDSDSAVLPSSVADGAFNLGVMDADGDQWSIAVNSVDSAAAANSNTWRAQRTDACIEEIDSAGNPQTRAAWQSMDSLGFTVNYSANFSTNNVYSLALAGLNFKAGNFTKKAGPVAPTFVQQVAKNAGNTVSFTTQAFPGASATGDLIVVSVNHDSAAVTLTSVTDSKLNTYIRAIGPTNWGASSLNHTSTYYAINTGTPGVITTTVTLTGNPTTGFEVFQLEYSGVNTVSPLDQVSAAFGNTVSPANSGSKTTTEPNELIYGFAASSTAALTAGITFTVRSTFDTQSAADKYAAAAGSYSADATFAGMKQWVSHMATFKGSQSFVGLDFQPSAMLLASFQDIVRGAPVAEARMGIGASDGTIEGTMAIQDADNLVTTDIENFDKTTKVFAKVDNSTSTIDAEADLLSLDADGFTLNWTTNDAVATQMLYVAFAPMWLTEVRLIPGSLTAAKYDAGVLVQWRTGYESDNLGFNVYREVNGVRTKVNSTLIAGSGLGGVTDLNYARWDLDPAALDPAVSYWLEDVEFNGRNTWHGPVTPVDSGLQEPTTPVDDSPELGDVSDAANSRRIFFNYNEDPVHPGPRVVPPQVEPQVTRQWVLAAQPTVKLGIRKPGWYRVTHAELVAGGLNAQVDPTTLQLFVDGTEQAIRVTGQTASSFDAIEFYGSGIDTAHTDTRTYWLQAGAQPGQRIAVAALESFAPSPATGFSSMLRRKDRSVNMAALRNGDAENWFGPYVFPDSDDSGSPTLSLTPHNVDRSSPGIAQLTVTLQGVTSAPDGSENHRIAVLVNGTNVGEMTFAGQANAEQPFPVDLALVADGENTVTLESHGVDADTDTSLVDAIRLDYPHAYQADADRLRFTVDAGVSIMVGGFAGTSIRVFDITDRAVPLELPTTIGSASGLSTVTVHVPGSGLRTLMAFSDETVSSPVFVRANHPSSWHTSNNAYDYVVIAHADFVGQAAPLAAHRQQQGHHAVVVDVEDVYDEFSFGERTPQAIRDFLQWARTNWAIAPRFVVLAGDSTTDPRDYQGYGDADFVPTKQVSMNQLDLETASDDWFVDFSDNGLPEVAIGRLPVRTAGQASTMVAKIVGYDHAVPQTWMKDVLLVADQNDLTGSFEGSSNKLLALLPQGYNGRTIFRGVLGDAAAHQAIIDRVNEGQLIVNYTGHGSTYLWGSNGALLGTEDVTDSWTNTGKLPFVVAMNCLNGLFNSIYGEESLAEAMVRAPNGGAVAVWASSSLSAPSTQVLLNEELFRLIFQGTYATVGEAVAAAKRVVMHPTVADQDLRRSLIFFGDPAMRLIGARPAAPIVPTVTAERRPGDFDGDRKADIAVYRPSTGDWFLRQSSSGSPTYVKYNWGISTDVIVPGDYDGDGVDDLALYRPSTSIWYILKSSTNYTTYLAELWGLPTDVPVPGDYDGDGKADLGLYHPSNGTWYIKLSSTGYATSVEHQWGVGDDRVIPGDYDGDGVTDPAVYRQSSGTWFILHSSSNFTTYLEKQWGNATDLTVPGDYDGDGKRDLAVYRPSTGTWWVALSTTKYTTYFSQQWGLDTDLAVPGDYDGDGKGDLAVYRPSTGVWYILQSSAGYTTYIAEQWGTSTDIPILKRN